MRTIPWLIIVTSLCLPGCGDDTGGGTGGSGPATGTGGGTSSAGGDGATGSLDADAAAAYCEAVVARDAECAVDDPTTQAACLSDELTICLFTGMRPGVRQAIADCVIARPCDAPGDLEACVYTPGNEDPAAGQEAYRDACLARRTECAGAFSDDDCAVSFFPPAGYDTLSACLEEDCASVGSCLRSSAETLCAGG